MSALHSFPECSSSLQSLNHCCDFCRETERGGKTFATRLAALGGAVAKGRDSEIDMAAGGVTTVYIKLMFLLYWSVINFNVMTLEKAN